MADDRFPLNKQRPIPDIEITAFQAHLLKWTMCYKCDKIFINMFFKKW